jgi:pimeloyl-ACP methyl ester carboxylesterase
MATVLNNYIMCAGKEGEARLACATGLQAQFTKMRANPTTKESWLGEANTWKVWASRLAVVDTNLLIDLNAPLLVYHGENDGAVHVQSARTLIAALKQPEGPDVRYWEIPNMGHGVHSLPTDEATRLHGALLEWLFTGHSDFEPSLP